MGSLSKHRVIVGTSSNVATRRWQKQAMHNKNRKKLKAIHPHKQHTHQPTQKQSRKHSSRHLHGHRTRSHWCPGTARRRRGVRRGARSPPRTGATSRGTGMPGLLCSQRGAPVAAHAPPVFHRACITRGRQGRLCTAARRCFARQGITRGRQGQGRQGKPCTAAAARRLGSARLGTTAVPEHDVQPHTPVPPHNDTRQGERLRGIAGVHGPHANQDACSKPVGMRVPSGQRRREQRQAGSWRWWWGGGGGAAPPWSPRPVLRQRWSGQAATHPARPAPWSRTRRRPMQPAQRTRERAGLSATHGPARRPTTQDGTARGLGVGQRRGWARGVWAHEGVQGTTERPPPPNNNNTHTNKQKQITTTTNKNKQITTTNK
jgi:hypothetical protein